MISQGTDYVGVPDDQLRWDTTRATISCSLRYKLVTSECNLAHLEIVCSRLHVLWKMLYLSFSRIACRLCLCVSFDLSRGVHIILSLSSFCCLVEKNNKQQQTTTNNNEQQHKQPTKTNKQAIRQTSKQTSKQSKNNQSNSQANKQTII